MRNCDAVIFDLDGTLLDTAEGILKSVKYTIKKMDLPPVTDEVIKTFIGPPMQRSFARVFGLDEVKANECANCFRDRYKGDDLLLARPYDGIKEAISDLRAAGIKCAVATYKRQDYAEKILVHFGFDRITDGICGADFEGKLTKKDIIENAMKTAGVSDHARAVMVGDSDNDAIGAREIGVGFVAVTYGFGFGSDDAAAAYDNIGIAKTPGDIVRIIL